MRIEVMKIRNTVYRAIHDYFITHGFYEVSPPVLTPFSCEVACVGGSDLISVNYYNRSAYLSQSGQLYLEALAMKLRSVYCIGPAFRAESTILASHLSEFWMCEAEMMNVSFEDLVCNANGLIRNIAKWVLENHYSELKALDADISQLQKVETTPLPQITYTDAVKILNKSCDSIKWGDDISGDAEKTLSEALGGVPFVLTHFPRKLSSFYKKVDSEDDKVVLSFDIIAPDNYRELGLV